MSKKKSKKPKPEVCECGHLKFNYENFKKTLNLKTEMRLGKKLKELLESKK